MKILNFCTLFDSTYLSRGILMYNSLKSNLTFFTLYIFAFDDLTFEILSRLKLDNVIVISTDQFETPQLSQLRNERTTAEYCWTCTPSVISYVFEQFGVDNCTYLDSDLEFYSDPSELISEMYLNNKNVLITEHGYSFLPRIYELKRSGRFCVQFITFTNDLESQRVLNTWKGQCINWCYAQHEDGKFGDQKYLDAWPELYTNIHILQNPGGGIAPWNIQKYFFFNKDGKLKAKKKKDGMEFEAFFYHFQYLKLIRNNTYDIGWYFISNQVKKLFYQPYLTKLIRTDEKLKQSDHRYTRSLSEIRNESIKDYIKILFKRVTRYNFVVLGK